MSAQGDLARELLRVMAARVGPPARPTEHDEAEDCGGMCFAQSCMDKAARRMGLVPDDGASATKEPGQ